MTALPSVCQETLAAIRTAPLELPGRLEAHVEACPGCAEARVAWLAQEEPGPALAPAGYFDQLPGRILAKLPAQARPRPQRPLLWAAAATLFLGMGLAGFRLGRATPAPLVEAALPPAPAEARDVLPDTPFQTGDEELDQLPTLSPEEVQVVLDRLATGRRP